MLASTALWLSMMASLTCDVSAAYARNRGSGLVRVVAISTRQYGGAHDQLSRPVRSGGHHPHGRPTGRRRPARGGVLRRGGLLGAAGPGGPGAGRRPGGRDPRRVAQPGRRRTGRRARGGPVHRRPGRRGRHPRGRSAPPTGPTDPTGASTARTSCSPGSATRWSPRTGWTRSRTARTPTTRVRPDRPGARAASNHRVLRPLAAAGLTKADVRGIARALEPAVRGQAGGARAWPPGSRTTRSSRRRSCGRSIRPRRRCAGSGFADLRVRHHGDIARIELPADDLVRAVTRAAARGDPRGRAGRRIPLRRRRSRPACSPARSPCRWCGRHG